jgi:hypothetical protein
LQCSPHGLEVAALVRPSIGLLQIIIIRDRGRHALDHVFIALSLLG